ncbi:MAG: PilZ domain-containing protein [Myxococcota bacterium]
MKPVSMLILSDAGAAGRELLARRDVELGWSLEVQEACAALERRRPRVVLAREALAIELLESARALLERVPVVVLLEPDGWENRARYFAAGATALVSAGSLPRILEAVTELTGLPTRHAPRVPYPQVVDVSLMGAKLYLEATELGAGGIAIRDFPPARIGDRVEVGLVMMEAPLVLSGMVVRSHVGRSGAVTEIAFNALDDEERTVLERFVLEERSRSATFPDPVGLTSDLAGGTFTLDLFAADDGSTDRWLDLLRKRVASDHDVKAPKWLRRLERDLTELERRYLSGARTPAFVRGALEMRVDLGRAQARLENPQALRETCELALDFCRSLTVEARGAQADALGQVPDIRAGILTQIYGWAAVEGDDTGIRAA